MYLLGLVFANDARTSASTKLDGKSKTGKIAGTSRQVAKLFRREVIWMQYFQWRNIITQTQAYVQAKEKKKL